MKRSKVLVVDDQPANVKLITAILKKDYEIIPAYTSCGVKIPIIGTF